VKYTIFLIKVICTSQGANGRLDYYPTVLQSHINMEAGQAIFLQFIIYFIATAYNILRLFHLSSYTWGICSIM